jgi:H+/Cl- antiporter ClcA
LPDLTRDFLSSIAHDDIRGKENGVSFAYAPSGEMSERSDEKPAASARDWIPVTLAQPGAVGFWLAVVLTGIGTGISAVVLTRLLDLAQHLAWSADPSLLQAAARSGPWRHLLVLAGAGVLTGLGQIVLVRLSSGNGIDTTEAIWFSAGRMPALRTLGSAVLSVVVVGMGASIGREGAPKQAGAVIANALSDRGRFSNERRRLLVACGAGAGLAAAYGVPVGGALFAIEVMRGVLALRMVLPALLTSLIAALVSWTALPDMPTYHIPQYVNSVSITCWALVAGPIAGVASVGYVRMIAWADRVKPKGRLRVAAPIVTLTFLGLTSIAFPQLLGNGKDITQLAFLGRVAPPLLLALLFLKPAATAICLGSGVPGGLLTPLLTFGAMLGGVLGYGWSLFWPGVPAGFFALVGAAAVLAATTQGPISAVVVMMELTGRDRSFIAPLLLAVASATLVSRSLEIRSIYDARLSEEQLRARQRLRDQITEAGVPDPKETGTPRGLGGGQ